MTDYRELPGLEENELPVDPVKAETEVVFPADKIIPENDIPELTEEPTEAIREQIEEVLDEEPAPVQISGRRVSILNREFETVVCEIDEVLNRALSIAVDARQGFSVTAKISLSPSDPSPRFAVSYNVGYKFDPIKVENKGALHEAIAISFDEDGNLIIPDGSSTQITMDEVTAGATVTADQDGVVQEVEVDGEPDSEPEILPGEPEEEEPDPYPCSEIDCWMNDEGDLPCCRLDPSGGNEPIATEDSDYVDAVVDFHCTRKCVLDRYNKIGGEING